MGIETGRKTQYTIWLTIPAGLMMSALFTFAISTTLAIGMGNGGNTSFVLGLTRSPGQYGELVLGARIVLWAFAIGSMIWFIYACSTVKASSESLAESTMRRAKLEELVKEKRESLQQESTI